jgi:hypothetical protein
MGTGFVLINKKQKALLPFGSRAAKTVNLYFLARCPSNGHRPFSVIMRASRWRREETADARKLCGTLIAKAVSLDTNIRDEYQLASDNVNSLIRVDLYRFAAATMFCGLLGFILSCSAK